MSDFNLSQTLTQARTRRADLVAQVETKQRQISELDVTIAGLERALELPPTEVTAASAVPEAAPLTIETVS